MTASIKCAPNGPLLVSGEVSVEKSDGTPIPANASLALCRCGGSKNKPFCDGSHNHNGFSGDRLADRPADRQEAYRGEKTTIYDNRGLCAHAGVCTDNLKGVFRLGEEPWIDPGGDSAERILDIIERCPSGALSCTIDGVDYNGDPDGPAQIRIVKNGPYAVAGAVELVNTQWGQGAAQKHFTLCRCGASKNKPFCDGSHWDVGFTDEVN